MDSIRQFTTERNDIARDARVRQEPIGTFRSVGLQAGTGFRAEWARTNGEALVELK